MVDALVSHELPLVIDASSEELVRLLVDAPALRERLRPAAEKAASTASRSSGLMVCTLSTVASTPVAANSSAASRA